MGALACSRVPRACAHIAKGLNGLLIENVSCTFHRGEREDTFIRGFALPTWIFLEFLHVPWNLFDGMENWSPRRTKGNNNSVPLPVFSVGSRPECYPRRRRRRRRRRRSLRGTLCTRYALRPIRQKLAGSFFDFRRQGRRVGHKSGFVRSSNHWSIPRSRWNSMYTDIRCKTRCIKYLNYAGPCCVPGVVVSLSAGAAPGELNVGGNLVRFNCYAIRLIIASLGFFFRPTCWILEKFDWKILQRLNS